MPCTACQPGTPQPRGGRRDGVPSRLQGAVAPVQCCPGQSPGQDRWWFTVRVSCPRGAHSAPRQGPRDGVDAGPGPLSRCVWLVPFVRIEVVVHFGLTVLANRTMVTVGISAAFRTFKLIVVTTTIGARVIVIMTAGHATVGALDGRALVVTRAVVRNRPGDSFPDALPILIGALPRWRHTLRHGSSPHPRPGVGRVARGQGVEPCPRS